MICAVQSSDWFHHLSTLIHLHTTLRKTARTQDSWNVWVSAIHSQAGTSLSLSPLPLFPPFPSPFGNALTSKGKRKAPPDLMKHHLRQLPNQTYAPIAASNLAFLSSSALSLAALHRTRDTVDSLQPWCCFIGKKTNRTRVQVKKLSWPTVTKSQRWRDNPGGRECPHMSAKRGQAS